RGFSHRTRKWREAETWTLCSWPVGDRSKGFNPVNAVLKRDTTGVVAESAGVCSATPELRISSAAAQTRIVSKARILLNSRKSVRSFKEIICVDISEFESSHPSHAVWSLCAMSRPLKREEKPAAELAAHRGDERSTFHCRTGLAYRKPELNPQTSRPTDDTFLPT